MEDQGKKSDDGIPQNKSTEGNENGSKDGNTETGPTAESVSLTTNVETGAIDGDAKTDSSSGSAETGPADGDSKTDSSLGNAETGATADGAGTSQSDAGGSRKIEVKHFGPGGTAPPEYYGTAAYEGTSIFWTQPMFSASGGRVAPTEELARLDPATLVITRLRRPHNMVASYEECLRMTYDTREKRRRLQRIEVNNPESRRASFHMCVGYPKIAGIIFLALLVFVGFIIFLVHSVLSGNNTKEDPVSEGPNPPAT